MRNGAFTPFYVVWTKPTASASDTKRPVRRSWASRKRAEDVCLEMARKHPGRKFFVLQAVTRMVVTVQTDSVVAPQEVSDVQ